jgi:hypothetical protein
MTSASAYLIIAVDSLSLIFLLISLYSLYTIIRLSSLDRKKNGWIVMHILAILLNITTMIACHYPNDLSFFWTSAGIIQTAFYTSIVVIDMQAIMDIVMGVVRFGSLLALEVRPSQC